MSRPTRRRLLLGAAAALLPARPGGTMPEGPAPPAGALTLFLSGDVMLGRGIDQILGTPGDPTLHEPYVRSATTYVDLAESVHGPIPRRVDPAYVWGDALETLRRRKPPVRIVNLETSVTRSEAFAPGKGIHYKMHPANVGVLTAAGIDCCVLANNHVLDWGRAGLLETLRTLEAAGLRTAGAGRGAGEASSPAALPAPFGTRVLVFAFGTDSSGIRAGWAARGDTPGVNRLPDLSARTAASIATLVEASRRPGDLLVASIHWGGNWGYEVPPAHAAFAHDLIDRAGFDVVHGHSSHHPMAIEVYRGRPILYGCGDFINDYEGIGGKEAYRADLVLAYLPRLRTADGTLADFPLEVFRIRKFRLQAASDEETRWLQATLDRESRRFGTRIERADGNRLAVAW